MFMHSLFLFISNFLYEGIKIMFFFLKYFKKIKSLVSHFHSNGVPKVLATPLWVSLLVQRLDQVYQEIPSLL